MIFFTFYCYILEIILFYLYEYPIDNKKRISGNSESSFVKDITPEMPDL